MSTEFDKEAPTEPGFKRPGDASVDGAETGNDLRAETAAEGNVGGTSYTLDGPNKSAKAKNPKPRVREPLGEHERPVDKAARVRFIIELMADNRWVTGITGPKLAYMWGLSEASLSADAAEASRFFLTTNSDREALKKRWLAKLESAQESASDKGRLEALSSLLKLEGDHLGVFEAQKVDVTVSGSDEQLAARVAALVAAGDKAGVPVVSEPGREEET